MTQRRVITDRTLRFDKGFRDNENFMYRDPEITLTKCMKPYCHVRCLCVYTNIRCISKRAAPDFMLKIMTGRKK